MTTVANLAIFSGVGAGRLPSASITLRSHTHFVVLTNYQEDEAMLREPLENLGRSPLAKRYISIVLAREAREGPNTQDQAEHLMAVSSTSSRN